METEVFGISLDTLPDKLVIIGMRTHSFFTAIACLAILNETSRQAS
jgi:hypothetical protein